MVTVNEIREWVEVNREELIESLNDNKDIPESSKGLDGRLLECWCAGCYLTHKLEEHGCPEDTRKQIGFAMGQRSAFGNPYKWAAAYLNEYISTGKVVDKPGMDLAAEINNSHMKKNDDSISIIVEDPT